MVSGVICFEGTASLVAYPVGTRVDGTEYRATLAAEHIPAVRRVMEGDDFVFIHVVL
jgi:hypothetical protein